MSSLKKPFLSPPSSIIPTVPLSLTIDRLKIGSYRGLVVLWSSDADGNVRVNWPAIVLWTAVVSTMVGCGLWSRCRAEKSPPPVRRRPFRKPAEGAMTSSEDEEEDDSRASRVDTKELTTTYKRFSLTNDYVDPGLLKKHSSYKSYTTPRATYPSVRTFYYPHPHMDKLPSKPSPIPLLVFVHGLGGSLAQFHPLLTRLTNVGPCFGIDLPGCGLSEFAPTSWDAYSIEAMAELLAVAIEQHRDKAAGQGVVLIAHSLGCSLSALLASTTSPVETELREHILGLTAVCPKATPPSPHETALFRRLLHIPTPIFNLWRMWDRRGGINSNSVVRFVGKAADPDTRRLQVVFNAQSRSAVWRRMAWGTLPKYQGDQPIGGMPGRNVWTGIEVPILLIAGEADAVTKPDELKKLLSFFSNSTAPPSPNTETSSIPIPDATQPQDTQPVTANDPRAHEEGYGLDTSTQEVILPADGETAKAPTKTRVVKTTILPAPAAHALLYDRATYRTVAGLIQDFVQKHIDPRLSLGWQLQHLNTSGKWDVKNLAKWKRVAPISEPIADTFVAMKILRGVDEKHNPVLFSQRWRDKIYAVIDISHQSPVYNPSELEEGGIHYHKHPTVSKVPPTPDETREFIGLVDQLEKEITTKLESNEQQKEGSEKPTRPLIGVHCHYGFNRTGFLIVSYLIERKGFSVQEAIDEFERCRPPGIRHDHFIDTLFVRYCVGLKRTPTL